MWSSLASYGIKIPGCFLLAMAMLRWALLNGKVFYLHTLEKEIYYNNSNKWILIRQ